MKKKHFFVILIAMAAMLSGCGNDRAANNISGQADVQSDTQSDALVEQEKTEPIHKFDVEKDVMLTYEYDSDGELSRVYLNMDPEASGFQTPETSYDEDGYLTSIKVRWEREHPSAFYGSSSSYPDEVEDAITAEYNADGQITYLRYRSPFSSDTIVIYKITYDSENGHITVFHNIEDLDDRAGIIEEYDSNFNIVYKQYDLWSPFMTSYVRHYIEYTYDEEGNVEEHRRHEKFDASAN